MGALYGPGDGVCSNGVSEQRCPKNGGSMFTCLDHDDGSDFYLDTRNVCVFAGMKNYIGQNKVGKAFFWMILLVLCNVFLLSFGLHVQFRC